MAAFVSLPPWSPLTIDTPDDLNRAEQALARACDRIRRKLCQTIDLVTGDVIVVQGTNTRALLLPELPVVAVASVTVDGVAVTDYTVDRENGLLWRTSPAWWPRGCSYTVTYTHGFAVIPEDIAGVAYDLTERYYNGSGSGAGIASESVDDYSVTYTSGGGGDDDLLAMLADRVVRKVPTA